MMGGFQWVPRKAAGLAGLGQSPAGPVGCLGQRHAQALSPQPQPRQFPGGPAGLSPRGPASLLLSLHSALPLSPLSLPPSTSPFPVPDVPGGLSSPPGSHPTLRHRLVQALCQTQKPHGSVCRVWPTSWTSEHARPRWQRDPGPRRSSLGASPQTWEAGLPRAMATRATGLTSVWPHRLPRRLESVKWARQPAWGGWLLAGGRQRGVGRGL